MIAGERLALLEKRLSVHVLHGKDATLPAPATDLYRELCSCALDAELTRLTGSWDLKVRAEHAGRQMPERVDNTAVSKKFRHVRHGGNFKPGHAQRLAEAYQSKRLMPCQAHRLAAVLCDPHIAREELMAWMFALGQGRVRRCVVEDLLTPFTGFKVPSRVPWGAKSIQRLIQIGSPAALFALICRARISQLEDDMHFDGLEEMAIWMLLPKAVGRSMSLLLGSRVLVQAIDFFLSWEPFAELRFDLDGVGVASELRCEALDTLERLRQRAIASGRIPLSEFERRSERAVALQMPMVGRGVLSSG